MTATTERYATLSDARIDLDGMSNWAWGRTTSWDGWTAYAWRHATVGTPIAATLAAYLESENENPADYDLSIGEPV
jgi:hypothetical protein